MPTLEEQIEATTKEWEAAAEVSNAAKEKTVEVYARLEKLVSRKWADRKKEKWRPTDATTWAELGEAADDITPAYEMQKDVIREFDPHLSASGTYYEENWLPGVDITLAKGEEAPGLLSAIPALVSSFGVKKFTFGVFSYHLSADGIREVQYRAKDGFARFGKTVYGTPHWDEWEPLEEVLRLVARRAYYPGDE